MSFDLNRRVVIGALALLIFVAVTAGIVSCARTRTPSERLPIGSQRLVIVHDLGLNAADTPKRVTVTDHGSIDKVASLLDSLEPAGRGTIKCPADDGAHFDLTFSTHASGPELAAAVVKTTGCAFVTITAKGHKPDIYRGNDNLVALLTRLDP